LGVVADAHGGCALVDLKSEISNLGPVRNLVSASRGW
jgi:hypothetical protein